MGAGGVMECAFVLEGVRVIRRLGFESEQVPYIRLAPSAFRLNPLIFPTVHSP